MHVMYIYFCRHAWADQKRRRVYIRATYALRVLYQLPLSDISTSCDRWHTYRIWALLCNLCHRRMQLCAGVRGPIQLSAAFLPLSVLFRDSMTAVNYGWTLSASCGSRANLGTTCACASAYGRRDAPSPVGLCLLRLGLGLSGFPLGHEKASILALSQTSTSRT